MIQNDVDLHEHNNLMVQKPKSVIKSQIISIIFPPQVYQVSKNKTQPCE